MNNIVLRIVGGLLGFLGLFLAAGAKDPGMFLGGMLFCLFGVLLNFWFIALAYSPDSTDDNGVSAH